MRFRLMTRVMKHVESKENWTNKSEIMANGTWVHCFQKFIAFFKLNHFAEMNIRLKRFSDLLHIYLQTYKRTSTYIQINIFVYYIIK